jgi:hypothetical protein
MMDDEFLVAVDEAIECLEKVPDVYVEKTLPCPIDDKISEVVSLAMGGTTAQRRMFYSRVTPDTAFTFRTGGAVCSVLVK